MYCISDYGSQIICSHTHIEMLYFYHVCAIFNKLKQYGKGMTYRVKEMYSLCLVFTVFIVITSINMYVKIKIQTLFSFFLYCLPGEFFPSCKLHSGFFVLVLTFIQGLLPTLSLFDPGAFVLRGFCPHPDSTAC